MTKAGGSLTRGVALALVLAAAGPLAASPEHGNDRSRLPDEAIPMVMPPARPKPIIEVGEPLLGTGTLAKGFLMPGGATWQPFFLAWGTFRTAFNAIGQSGNLTRSEWVNRLDLIAQLNMTSTERVLVSLRPLDKGGRFTGYTFRPDATDGSNEEFNAIVRTLFFEGDFGELLPNLDPKDFKALDYGFAFGRMPVFFQDGMLIDHGVDGVGIVRNSLVTPNHSNLRITTVYGLGNMNRGAGNVRDPSARMFGIFTETDTYRSTIDVDLVYVRAGRATGDGVYAAVSSVQRIGILNTHFRVLGSYALDRETNAVRNGTLVSGEVAWTPHGSINLIYINAFAGVGSYSVVSRTEGGALGRMGIVYAGAGLGGYAPVLRPNPAEVAGVVMGYQHYLEKQGESGARAQLIFELALRQGFADAPVTPPAVPNDIFEAAFATRYQKAFGRHFLSAVEGFVLGRENASASYGTRGEFQVKF